MVAAAPKDTSDKMLVNIDRARDIIGFRTDSGDFRKIVGDVILRQGTDTLYCDSAIQNLTTKNFEAFGHVKIAQAGGTKGASDYLRYTSMQKLAYMHGNVELTDGKNNLSCEDLTYDLGTKIAVYDNWGLLHNDSTTVTSKQGIYSSNEKKAHFIGTVYIKDPQYVINSEDVVYNTETKVTEFYAKSTVVRDAGKSILQTNNGWYDGVHGIAHFLGHSSIWNDGQYIEADTLNYNKVTGYGVADGHVISIDTQHHSTIFCGHTEYFQWQKKLWATVNPVLMQVNAKDTIYMAADTFYSAPMTKAMLRNPNLVFPQDTTENVDNIRAKAKTDSMAKRVAMQKKAERPAAAHERNKQKSKKKRKGAKERETVLEIKPATDTAGADTTAPLYFIGYHHVLIFSDSLQGKCDSVSYTRSDSVIRMIYDPIAWSRKSQITGDTILMQMDSSSINRMYVPNNAFVVSLAGPEKAELYDQVQGKTLTAWFSKNQITKMLVRPNAESIYFEKDEKGEYLGVTQTTSVDLLINFNDQKITKIKLVPDHTIKMTPLEDADIHGLRLSKFKWLIEQRPKSKEELFKN